MSAAARNADRNARLYRGTSGDGSVDRQLAIRQVERLQEQIGRLYEELGSLKLQLEELADDNQRLATENEHLRERARLYLDEHRVETSEAAMYLRDLYEEGFHICNVNYGGLRQGECLFCLQNLQRTS